MKQRIKIAFMALALSASLSSLAAAKPLEEGMDAYLRGDYANALKLLVPLAQKGDPAAQSSIGFMYQNGLGVPQDPNQAATWFHEAAEHGYAPAMVNLGAMYEVGAGVPQDNVEAHKWYSLAIANLKAPAEATARDVAAANRDALAARMTESELADARQAATDWKPK
jgi:TPR repeat protein